MINFEFDTSIICPDDKTATPERIEQYKEYYSIKYMICKLCQPKKIIEIGVRCGYSAWAFLQACPDAEYIGIDANNGTHGGQGGEGGVYFEWAQKILKPYNANFWELDTQKRLQLPAGCLGADLAHIDGDHTQSGCLHDLELTSKCKYQLVDDYDYIKEITNAVFKYSVMSEPKKEFVYFPSLRGEVLFY